MDHIQIDINNNLAGQEVDFEEKLKNLPLKPGVYQFKNDLNKVIYIGKAINLRNRVRSYFQDRAALNPKNRMLVSKIRNIEIIVTDNEVEALILESNLIKSLKPRYNVLLKDDKSFPYIRITNEPYPQVFPTRKIIKDGSKYFGPYTEVKLMRMALKIIRDILQVRNCRYYLDEEVIKLRKVKLCLEYQIHKCGGPCEDLVGYAEYQNIIKNVIKLLNGKTNDLIKMLQDEMDLLASQLKFEEAAVIKNKLELINFYTSRQKVVFFENIDRDIFAIAMEDDDACCVVLKVREGKLIDKRHFYLSKIENKNDDEILEAALRGFYLDNDFIPDEIFLQNEIEDIDIVKKWLSDKKGSKVELFIPQSGEKEKLVSMCKSNAKYMLDELKIQKMKRDSHVPYSIKALQKDLSLKVLPVKIECFDISNIQGSDSVASMVVFEDGRPKKSEYRKFIIKTVEGPNDFESMKEVVGRRYKRLLEEKKKLPGLIIVDGGKGQLSSAVEALDGLGIKDVQIIGLAKRLEEVFFPSISEAQMLPKTSSSLRLLQNIRDEAHRFAITFHRERREKRIINTELEEISSIGPEKARKLLSELGSVEAVKHADNDALTKIVGKRSAEELIEYFKNKN
jgi:excinuclease ABC subunit C